MRKAISLFLAASVLCLATSAMAAPTQSGVVSGMRNTTPTFGATSSDSMPSFRPGDTITFTIGSLTAGEELTLITYKNGASPSDSTVQYINQYTVSGTTQDVNYTIRDLTSGIYRLELNGGTNGTKTFYYKVGSADVYMLSGDGDGRGRLGTNNFVLNGPGNPYIIKQASDGKWSVGFIGKVTIDSVDISLSDIGAKPGFSISHGGTTKNYGFESGTTNSGKTIANLDLKKMSDMEISGSYSFLYGMTIYNITNGDQAGWTANAVLDTANAQ